MQAPVLHHTELTNAPVSPFLQTIQVLPKNSLLTSALNTPCNLMSAKDPRSALHPLAQTVSGDGQQYWAPLILQGSVADSLLRFAPLGPGCLAS